MWFFDPTLLLFIVPGLLVGLWAQARVRSAYARASRIRSRRGLTGVDTAKTLLDVEGVSGVRIQPTLGLLSDHYNPLSHELRLSVVDHGDWRAGRPDPARGRGLPLMRTLMDDVDIELLDPGTRVVLRRNVATGEPVGPRPPHSSSVRWT